MTRWHQAFPETSLIDRYALEMRIGDLIVFGRNVSQLSASIDSLNYYYTRVKRTLGATGIADTTNHKTSRHCGQSLAKRLFLLRG